MKNIPFSINTITSPKTIKNSKQKPTIGNH
jgi:hypothetical protein